MKRNIIVSLLMIVLCFSQIAAAQDGIIFPNDCKGNGFSVKGEDTCVFTLTEDTPLITKARGDIPFTLEVDFSGDFRVGAVTLAGSPLILSGQKKTNQLTVNGGISCGSLVLSGADFRVMKTNNGDHYEAGRLIDTNESKIVLRKGAELTLYQPVDSRAYYQNELPQLNEYQILEADESNNDSQYNTIRVIARDMPGFPVSIDHAGSGYDQRNVTGTVDFTGYTKTSSYCSGGSCSSDIPNNNGVYDFGYTYARDADNAYSTSGKETNIYIADMVDLANQRIGAEMNYVLARDKNVLVLDKNTPDPEVQGKAPVLADSGTQISLQDKAPEVPDDFRLSFAGYSDLPDGGEIQESVTLNEDMFLYANWEMELSEDICRDFGDGACLIDVSGNIARVTVPEDSEIDSVRFEVLADTHIYEIELNDNISDISFVGTGDETVSLISPLDMKNADLKLKGITLRIGDEEREPNAAELPLLLNNGDITFASEDARLVFVYSGSSEPGPADFLTDLGPEIRSNKAGVFRDHGTYMTFELSPVLQKSGAYDYCGTASDLVGEGVTDIFVYNETGENIFDQCPGYPRNTPDREDDFWGWFEFLDTLPTTGFPSK